MTKIKLPGVVITLKNEKEKHRKFFRDLFFTRNSENGELKINIKFTKFFNKTDSELIEENVFKTGKAFFMADTSGKKVLLDFLTAKFKSLSILMAWPSLISTPAYCPGRD